MKKKNIVLGLFLSAGLIVAGAATLYNVENNKNSLEVKASAVEPNDLFASIYSDDWNNTTYVEGFNHVLITLSGTAHGLGDSTISDQDTLSNFYINGSPLINDGSVLFTWGGQNWFRVVYPVSKISSGAGCTLEVATGATVGESVLFGFTLTLDSNLKWQFTSWANDFQFDDPVNATYKSIFSDAYNNGTHTTGYNRLLITYNGPAHGNPAAIRDLAGLKKYDAYVLIDGVPISTYQGGQTQITAWTDQTWVQFIYPDTAVSVGSTLTINEGCKVGNAVFEKIEFKLNSDNKWVRMNYIADDSLIKNSDYVLFTPSDFGSHTNSDWPFYLQNAAQLNNLNFGIQFNLTLTETQLDGYQTLRFGTSLTGYEYLQLLINYKVNTYINRFNGVNSNVQSSIATISVTADETHLFEFYSIMVGENSVRFLLGIDGLLIFKTDALDATGASCTSAALFKGTVADADQAFSQCDTTKTAAINRFYSKKLANPVGNTWMEKYQSAKAYHDTYLTANQQTALANEGAYAGICSAYQLLAAEALTEYKNTAKSELNNYVQEQDYTASDWQTIQGIMSDGCDDIDDATTVEQVDQILSDCKDQIDAIQSTADLLQEAIANAKTELANYVDPNNYREAQQNQLANILSNAYLQLDGAESIEEVNDIVAGNKDLIDTLKTAAEYEAEELAAYKVEKKSFLDTYEEQLLPDYREAEQQQITQGVAQAKIAIDAATSIEAVDQIISNLETQLTQLKTKAQYEAEEAQALADAKAAAKADLEAYKADVVYRLEEQQQRAQIIADCESLIDNMTNYSDIPQISVEVNAAKAQIDALLTKAQHDAAEARDVTNAINALPDLTIDNYLSNEQVIVAARNAYNALSPEGKALVGNLMVLEIIEARLAELKAEKANAEEVEALINQIGTVNSTQACKNKIDAAYNAYQALNNEEKRMVSNKDVLDSALTNFDNALGISRQAALDDIDDFVYSLNMKKYSKENQEYIEQLAEEAKDLVQAQTYSDNLAQIVADFKAAVNEIPQKKESKKGCGGSIVATSVILSALALSGACLLTIKKRKED